MHLISALAILMPSNASQKRTSNRTESGKDHVTYNRSTACSQESIDATALFLFNMFASGIVFPTSASTVAAAATAVSTFVVLVIITLVVLIFPSSVDGLILF